MKPLLVIIIAPPGGGKGTQADLLAKKFSLFHLETSSIIEKKFESADPDNKAIQQYKKDWLAGELIDPKAIAQWLTEEVKKLASEGRSLVLSGSPRTFYEAEYDTPIFEAVFGKESIKIFEITLSEEESIKRNSGRRICQANRHPIPNFPEYQGVSVCPEDDSPIVKRELDKPEIIRERYRVYKEETEPVLDYFRKRGYQVMKVNGEQPIERVFEDILKKIDGDQ